MSRAAVVVGSGSAGRRHLVALRAHDPDLAVTVVRRAGANGDGPPGASRVVSSLPEGLDPVPVVGVVAGPAPFHPDAIRQLLGTGAAVLTEKPLSHSAGSALRLRDAAGVDERLVVGYHLRFGDVAPAVRRLLADGIVGTVTSAHLSVGQHLSDWRPGTDPAASVSARHELGGGVLLELSHELDAVRFLLDTEVTAVREARLGHDGAPTDGIVETQADLHLDTEAGPEVTVHLDMVSSPAHRRWRIRGTEGTLDADLLSSTITLECNGRPAGPTVTFEPGERDRAEARLITHLFDVASGSEPPRCGLKDGLAALEIIEAVRCSAATGAPRPMSEEARAS